MAKKFYAVKIGRKTGIFQDWVSCKAAVQGFSGAVYKSFSSETEANEYMSPLNLISTGNNETVPDTDLIAYVDGSYIGGSDFGSGVVIIKDDSIIDRLSEKTSDKNLATMRNVAGEIQASKMAMQYALDRGYTSVTIFHDYAGIAHWPLGEWKANKEGTKAYKAYYDEIKNKLIVRFVKVKGHSGVKYNEEADRLAKAALGLS